LYLWFMLSLGASRPREAQAGTVPGHVCRAALAD
ncbi:MAG: hypothetical protein K0S98_1267, partial [Propionibacteriaceae bacterium]|nr:hypothetical protein [Propionibacteriaceae bacterium]